MLKLRKSNSIFFGIALVGAVALSWTTVMAGQVSVDATVVLDSSLTETSDPGDALDFGTIDLSPSGDTFIVDASAGPATAATNTGGSILGTGGDAAVSGVITVESDSAFTIEVSFDNASETLTGDVNGETITLSEMDTYSTVSVAHAAGTPTEVNIGGELEVPEGTVADTYNGTIAVTLDYVTTP